MDGEESALRTDTLTVEERHTASLRHTQMPPRLRYGPS